jgi:hypothetical protein
MICPHCRYEYESWVTTCPDCGSALTPPVPPAPAREPLDLEQFRDWTVLMNVPNSFMGHFLKDQLEDAGIPVLMKRSRATDIAEWSHNDFVMQDLYVPRRFLQRARRLVNSPPSSGYAGTTWAPDTWDGDEEDDDTPETPEAPFLAPEGPAPQAGWYLFDSPNPAPTLHPPAPAPASAPDAPLGAANEALPLPSLSRYQETLAERKGRRLGARRRAVPVVPAADHLGASAPAWAADAPLDYDPDDDRAPTNWMDSPIYRILMGLLLLAWTLPFILQVFQYFGDFWDQFLR